MQQAFIDIMNRNPTSTVEEVWREHVEDSFVNVRFSTAKGWWTCYQKYGMTPFESMKLLKELGRKYKHRRQRTHVKVNGHIEQAIRRIIDLQPELYLDEIQNQLYMDTGVLISLSSIWRVMVNRLGWSHRLYQAIAR